MRNIAKLCFACILLAGASFAQTQLELPVGARETKNALQTSLEIATGPALRGHAQLRTIRGTVKRQAYRIEATPQESEGLRDILVSQLSTQGFQPVFECSTQSCGGFDFRFSLDMLSAPALYINITDFAYAALENPDTQEAFQILTSSGKASYIAIDHVIPKRATEDTASETKTISITTGSDPQSFEFDQVIAKDGRVILGDLDFAPGSSELGNGPYKSLENLAKYLAANTEKRMVLVGHSDNVGGLDPNIRLSSQRATSAMQHLIKVYKINPERLDARGVGYLSPIADNATQEGRKINRRVEAVLLN